MIEQYFELKYMQEIAGIILVLGVMVVSIIALIIAFLYVVYKTKKK